MTRALLLLALATGCGGVRHIPAPVIEASPLSVPPAKAQAHYVRGRLALLTGKLEAADKAFSMARLFDPQSPWIPIAQGEVALVRGDVQAAARAWQEATRVDPECATGWVFLARVDRLRGKVEAAAGHYRKARSLGYGWQAWAGEIDSWMHAGKPERAREVLSEWKEEASLPHAEAAERGLRRLRLGDPEGASRDLLPAVRARPESLGAVRSWVTAVLECDDRRAALREVDALQALAPTATAPLWASAILGDAEGDQTRVSAALKAWQSIAPEDEALQTLRRAIKSGGKK